MKKDKSTTADLRQRAEDLQKKKPLKSGTLLSDDDTIKLIHELEVHQIELELQNEELKLAKINADIAAKKYTELYDFAPTGYFTLSREGIITESNFLGAEMLGKTRSELKNKKFTLFVSKECKVVFNTFIGEILKNTSKQVCELVLKSNGHQPIHAILSGIAIEETDRCTITVMDITESRQAEDKLRESEGKFRSITEQTSDLIAITDAKGIVTYASPASKTLFQFDPEEMCGRNFIEFLDEQEISRAFGMFSDALKGNNVTHVIDLSMKRKDGSIFIGELTGSKYQQGLMNGTLVIIRDITAKKQYDQMITQAVIDSEDKQRLVFAQELHDGLGPMLATIKLFLMSMHNKKEKENIEHLIDRVNEIIDASIIILKELSLNLSPHILTNHGINNAVEDFLNRTKVDNITVKFKSNLSCRLSNPIETGLYRIITELVNNSVKHADATQINILIRKSDDNVKLEYSDNGCGFDLDSILQTSKGNGLFNIINRAKSMDAKHFFSSSYENGFSFNVKIKT